MPTSAPQSELLAVYGTLQRNCANHDRLLACGCEYVRACLIPGRLYDLGAYPGIQLCSATTDTETVHGELYRCPADALSVLDQFEGATGDRPLFERKRVTLLEPEQSVWVYEYARPVSDANRVTDGVWRE